MLKSILNSPISAEDKLIKDFHGPFSLFFQGHGMMPRENLKLLSISLMLSMM